MSSEKNKISLSIGELIVKLRKDRGLRQNQLAEKSGLTVQGLGQIEKGRTSPKRGTLRLIATALDLPADYFLNPKADAKSPKTKRLVIELDLPEDADLSEAQLRQLRRAMLDAGRHILGVIKDLDKAD